MSIFEALGGGQLTPTASDPIWSDRSSFGGDADIVTSGFGLYGDEFQATLNIPIASYELDGFERAIARQAKANLAFWSTINSHQSAATALADPDDDSQWKLATDSTLSSDGIAYLKIVQLIPDTELNRCKPKTVVIRPPETTCTWGAHCRMARFCSVSAIRGIPPDHESCL